MKAIDKPSEKATFPLYLISGNTKQNDIPITIAYIGNDYKTRLHWVSMIFKFSGDPKIIYSTKENAKQLLRASYPECSMLLIEQEVPDKTTNYGANTLLIPRFINTDIDLSIPMEVLRKGNRSHFARIWKWIIAQKISYELTQSVEAQKDFYYNMYRPFHTKMYNERALIIDFEAVFKPSVHSEILFIKKEDKILAGAVIRTSEGRPAIGFIGVKEEHFLELEKWYTGAFYYFIAEVLQKRGFKKLRVGGSPPFFTKGLLFFKMRLTSTIDHYEPYQIDGRVSCCLMNETLGLRDFLTSNPFVFVKENGDLSGAIWLDSRTYASVDELKNVVGEAFKLGLEECKIIYWGKKPKLKARGDEFENKTIRFVPAQKYFDNKTKLNFRKIHKQVFSFLKTSFRGFDEAGYLAANPDVAQAVNEGKISSGKKHYRRFGRGEGRANPFFEKTINPLSKENFVPLYLVSGRTRQNNIPITIAYVGHDQLKLVQWASLIMDTPVKRHLGNYPFEGLINYPKKKQPECSLAIIERDLPGVSEEMHENGFSLPYFMQMYIDISEPIEELRRRSQSGFKNAARLIRKYSLSYDIVNSPEAQHNFYYNMYLPYQKSRHGEISAVVALHNVFSEEIPFEIFRIKNGNEIVAAVVVRYKEKGVYLSFLGVKNGVFGHVKKGAVGAVYYFTCDALHKRGYKKLYIGGSPPFLNNPITAYKIRMTAQIDKDYYYENHELTSCILLNDSEATRDFLINSPFIFINNSSGNVGAVWVDSHKNPNGEDFEKEINQVFKLGLNECQIIYWGKKPKLRSGQDGIENKIIRFVKARKFFDSKWMVGFRKMDKSVSAFLNESFRRFDEAGYLAANPDVAQAVKDGKFSSGKQHHRKFGKSEGRNKEAGLTNA